MHWTRNYDTHIIKVGTNCQFSRLLRLLRHCEIIISRFFNAPFNSIWNYRFLSIFKCLYHVRFNKFLSILIFGELKCGSEKKHGLTFFVKIILSNTQFVAEKVISILSRVQREHQRIIERRAFISTVHRFEDCWWKITTIFSLRSHRYLN